MLRYVEVIHTNGAEFGFYYPFGGADFYPNGGAYQPSCGYYYGICSHLRSIKYFTDSLQTPIYAYQCESFNAMKQGICYK